MIEALCMGFISKTNELIYDNYNALAFGWSPTDRVGHTFCSIAVGRTTKKIHFGFYWGSQIRDPKKNIAGSRQSVPVHSRQGQRRFSQSLYHEIDEGGLCQFPCKSETANIGEEG